MNLLGNSRVDNLKIPFITGFSAPPASSSHPQPQECQIQRLSRRVRKVQAVDVAFFYVQNS